MPKYKKDAREFKLKVINDGQRLNITIPGVLHSRLLKGVVELHGRFVLREREMVLYEEYRTVTVEHLVSQWWDTHVIDREELNDIDWDDLLSVIGLDVADIQGKEIIISDFDNTTYGTGTWWISFSEQ
jgi:hypothetical protein